LRKLLDRIYRASGAIAALFLVAICVVVLLQVGANAIDALIKLFGGEPLGLVIPSYAEFAGFFLAGASFFALAYTLRAGGHIRVTLLLAHLAPWARRAAELWCVAAALFVSGYFAWYSFGLVAESLEYHDVSSGIVPVPLWLPQSVMALGLAVLTLAFADELWQLARGRPASYAEAEAAESAE
jgi:TRAP-type C4-dicarboxylate transport system permease small subunit